MTAFRSCPRWRSVVPVYFIENLTAAFRVPTKARAPAELHTFNTRTCDALPSLKGIGSSRIEAGEARGVTTPFRAGVAARQSDRAFYPKAGGINDTTGRDFRSSLTPPALAWALPLGIARGRVRECRNVLGSVELKSIVFRTPIPAGLHTSDADQYALLPSSPPGRDAGGPKSGWRQRRGLLSHRSF